ncbi:hypothetical protein SYJ56_14405 [Algoriphagus sp. D3-2-R+10]|uniref:hypothetical protein n=1 Tax=Algoriphagus aurantiacus TaxID=3103948 RepID=UPI002B3E809C|nr:hypothetical protein [Algoriphagus sp. D3-2-R+10]MEB2776511.1 hypothetical protein [Algoriphagus sp. D3-2-R+10]
MKNLLILSLFALLFFSCEKLDEPEILGGYVNTPEGCTPGENPEFNCSRLIILSAGGVAEVLYGGDIFSRTSYKIKGDKIKIEKNDQFGLDLTFKKLDDGSLREEGDKSIWVKQDDIP